MALINGKPALIIDGEIKYFEMPFLKAFAEKIKPKETDDDKKTPIKE